MTTPSRHWRIKHGLDLQTLIETLQTGFQVEYAERQQHSVDILDSFGWDIWHSGALLTHSDQQLRLLRADSPSLSVHTAAVHFWWDLPQCPLQNRLKSILGYWSFNCVAQLKFSQQDLVLRNEDEKIVVRGRIIQHEDAKGSQNFLSLDALRGYTEELNATAKLLDALPLESCQPTNYRMLLEQRGIQPRVLDRKPVFGLQAEHATEAACRQMARHMAKHARDYEDGIKQDIDTEYLHQYRVSLRKARSLISLLKGAFPEAHFQRLKKALGDLAGPTGKLRDLDVFLLDKDHYARMLPAELSEGFTELCDLIGNERQAAQSSVNTQLNSKRYQQNFKQVLKQLAEEPQLKTKLASKAVKTTVDKKALGRYQKIVALGSAITAQTSDDDVHELRIECKKLRYLMEFFAELYPPDDIKSLIAALKGLQDILGKFNDFCVQKEFLLQHLSGKRSSSQLPAAIGGLVALLHQQQLAARRKVQSAFADFARDEVASAFSTVFTAPQERPA